MILREIKNMYIKNRLTEGVDYVRKEWLVGDGSAYINTNIKPSENLRTKTKAAYTSSSDSISRNSAIFGSSLVKSGTVSNRYWVNYDRDFEIGYGGYYSTQYSINPNQDIEIDFNYIEDNTHKFKINNSVYTRSGEPNTTRNIVIFGRNVNGSVYVRSYRVSYFQLINSSNLIMDLVPCQLLKPIPATLDANNIARSAGECGMYDSVSGKFFGNVASTGSFTVKGDVESETHTGLQQIYQNKLIEGVDYQTADWLKADIPIDITLMSLPINSRNFEFKRNFIQLMNSHYFNTLDNNNSYAYYITDINNQDPQVPKIWSNGENKTVYSSTRIGLGVHTISANDNGVTISSATNTATLPWYGEPKTITFNNASNFNRNTIHLTSSIKVDGVTRYVPCQLLRSIPRNLDAQCKERVAGECGMIDLISGKFYGNVANSGTFTVENDNNE